MAFASLPSRVSRLTSLSIRGSMGLGVNMRSSLPQQGCKMRVYIPFGTQWAPYFLRRLAERPANLLFLLKNLFQG